MGSKFYLFLAFWTFLSQDPLDFIHMPFQRHKALLEDVAVQARMSWTAHTRQHLQGVGDIDREVLRQVLAKRSDEDCRILKHTITLASWANDKLCEAGFADSPRCELCGQTVQCHDIVCDRVGV